MGGRSRLPGGLPRLLADHNTVEGRHYRRAYVALETEYGPFRTDVVRFAAGRVALLEVSLTASSRALDAARRQRTRGKGRRPSERQLERLARRVGLDDGSYQAALDRLREMATASSASARTSSTTNPLRALAASRPALDG